MDELDSMGKVFGMSNAAVLPIPGQIALVRQRLYLVEETIPPTNTSDSTLVRLSCIDDDAQGQKLEVLWDRELDPKILTEEAWESIARRGFDPPRLFAAYLNTLHWNCVTATDPRLFQSPCRAGIRLDAYQLEPLRKAPLRSCTCPVRIMTPDRARAARIGSTSRS